MEVAGIAGTSTPSLATSNYQLGEAEIGMTRLGMAKIAFESRMPTLKSRLSINGQRPGALRSQPSVHHPETLAMQAAAYLTSTV
ncbi:hypothetical protein, partial [Xanthomonas hortorum]|uniref:hypothetical protein n=1 Tax=Xanthomonas hortorum TaxID=56454 RepID=UPI002FE18EB1